MERRILDVPNYSKSLGKCYLYDVPPVFEISETSSGSTSFTLECTPSSQHPHPPSTSLLLEKVTSVTFWYCRKRLSLFLR